jgi:hypothetical protein
MFSISPLKKIISLTAVILLLFNTGGYIIIYQQLIFLNRNDIQTKIANDEINEDLILLSFKKSDIQNGKIDFRWKHSKEFKYKSDMYDVVEKSETKDSISFFCYRDIKEKKYEESFNKHYENENGSEKQIPDAKIISKIKLGDLFATGIFNLAQKISKRIFPLSLEHNVYFNEIDIPSPPPKVISFI